MDEFDAIMAEFESTMNEFDTAYDGYETAMGDVQDLLSLDIADGSEPPLAASDGHLGTPSAAD